MNLRRRALGALLRTSSPIQNGSLRLPGLQAPLIIRRDRFSIPYIEAQSDDDAWFGLGFCQGQDRAFQLELRLRTVRGTLSAVIGSQTLAVDRLARRVGFRASSEKQHPALDADIRTQIEAFVRGINAGIENGGGGAPEFRLLRFQPTLWQAADVVGVGKLMSFLLVGNWDVELARLKILTADGPDALRELDPFYPDDHVVSAPPAALAGPAADRLSDDLAAFVGFAGTSGGSNNWAIAGARTASGRPILANDPHLDPALPPHWYLAHLRTPDWGVAGASLIGSPAIGAGHNGFAAWGITAGLADTTDLFIEELGADGRSVRQGDAFVACEVRREVIEVKGDPAVAEDVVETPRGPIIGHALDDSPAGISLRAVWLDPNPARGFLGVHTARSLEQFREQFRQWPLLSQNVAYADVDGHIAWQLVGEVPRRRKGWGTLPQSGADPGAGWLPDTVPFEQMPFVVDPPHGFVATANNKPVADDGDGPYLGVDWLDGYRAGRIAEALSGRDDWDVDSALALQLDTVSLAWREVRDVILALPATTDDAALALTLLRAWDGHIDADSTAATIYELFVRQMWRRVAVARAPNAWEWAIGRGFADLMPFTTFASGRVSRLLGRLVEQPEGWFPRPWPHEMGDALAAVVSELRAQFGPSPERWAWGSVRRLTLEHPLGRVKALAPIVNRGPYVWGGDGGTISQAGINPLRPLGNPLAIASLRMAVEVGDWDAARFVMPGGQSGDPFSPHYDDMVPFWLRGEGLPIAWSPVAVSAVVQTRLRLLPLTPPPS